jgi:hypothetical protein
VHKSFFREKTMTIFLAMYLAPATVIDEWAKTDPETRRPAEEKMRGDWMKWMGAHASVIKDTQAAGKTKRVGPDGVSDSRNDIMLYSLVEADSHEAAARMFEGHPHLGIPQASIEVMEVRSMGGG